MKKTINTIFRRAIVGTLCFFMLLSLTTPEVQAKTKTYTAKGWATKYDTQAIVWCPSGDYEDCNTHGDVDDYECPLCGKELVYACEQNSYVENFKYRHVDYTVTVKKGKTCIVKFPTQKKSRRAKIGRCQGQNWYDYAQKVKNIKHISIFSGTGTAKKYGSNKIKVKCMKECKFVLCFGNYNVVTLRVKIKK